MGAWYRPRPAVGALCTGEEDAVAGEISGGVTILSLQSNKDLSSAGKQHFYEIRRGSFQGIELFVRFFVFVIQYSTKPKKQFSS